MTLAGYVTGWATEYAAGIEYAAEGGAEAIERYLDDMDANGGFITNERGEYCGTRIELCVSPHVTFYPHTGIVRTRDTSARQTVTVGVKVSDAAREAFNEYFAAWFEIAQASGDFDEHCGQDGNAWSWHYDEDVIDIFAPLYFPEAAE